MPSLFDWKRLLEMRRRLTAEPDDVTLEHRFRTWSERLQRADERWEHELDRELIELLEDIQRAP